MSKDQVWVRNTLTGKTGQVPRKLLEHPILSGGSLVEVEPGSKSYVPVLYRSRTVEEYQAEQITTPVDHDSEDAE